ncbi:HipA family kinase [Clostridium chromiireducens]|uniref:HipA-like kinase domain-containing protein n=1 Tax=Clostridium chromiireducens TaxID=225345 RepID=A0A1V4INH1_9CLOT|nr:HipA family kinase [Clostridium chromiireducens]OPJ61598.1 hypothetical protein CLCHR_23920 [Clostridium chromiireducens]
MDTYHVDELLYPIGNGATIPILGVVNNKNYIIKTFNNIEGNKTLINELVCHYIAKKLNFPIPDAKLGIIDANTVISKKVLDLEDFSDSCFGLAFCSEFLEPVTVVTSSKMLQLASNHKWLLPKLMLFDHLIYNKDRNKGNLLISLSKSNRQLYIIDHSHTFNLEALWNTHALEYKIIDEDFKDSAIMADNWYHYAKFKSVLELDLIVMKETVDYFKENLTKDFLESIVDKIPEVFEHNKNELKALIQYLLYRMEHIDYYADLILNTNY